MNRLETMKISGKDYAKVPTRVKAFRESNPRASIETKPTIDGNIIMFEAKIVQDKADDSSPSATGHSYGENDGAKAFEKLETIAVGRALALLGYLNNGEIATSEELDEFNAYKESKVEEAIMELEACTTLEELKSKFLSLGNLMTDTSVVQTKDRRKVELNASTALTAK